MITLGATDLANLRAFYRRVGWEQLIDDEDFAAFDVHGVVVALFPVTKLAADGRGQPEPGTGGIRFTIGIMVDAPDQVDSLADRMRSAGATVTKPAVDAEFFTGRSAYLADPEGNFFEIAWAGHDNPITSRRARRE